MSSEISTKRIIRVNASSLRESSCLLRWHRTIVEGYYQGCKGAYLVYGVGVHKYIDTMFKTGGDMSKARDAAMLAFDVPKVTPQKSQWLADKMHFLPVCFDVWDDWVLKDTGFDIVQMNSECWYCDGTGLLPVIFGEKDGTKLVAEHKLPCPHCGGVEDKIGTGMRMQPATEVTFSIKFYEDDFCIVYLEGTIDKIGKIKNGCYAIGDYKTTSKWFKDEYLKQYGMSAQLRFYVLALKLMAEQHPESMLGKIGSTKVGAFIDGIFLKPKCTDTEYKRSEVFIFSDKDLAEFRTSLTLAIERFSDAIQFNSLPKEGIFNGSCKGEWGLCQYWNVCAAGSDEIGRVLLKRDFKNKEYNPLNHS